jgi:uncharacterized RDD family membrane protein YckC
MKRRPRPWPTPEVAARLATPPLISVPSANGVDVRLVLAGPGARSVAFILDWLMRSALAIAWFVIAAIVVRGDFDFQQPDDSEVLWFLVVIIPSAAIFVLYHLVLEIVLRGRTPGKRMSGLRVLTLEGTVPGVGALVTRNIFRIIDSMPFGYIVGLLFVMLGRQHARLGDLAAGTVVVVDRAPFLAALEDQARRRGQMPPLTPAPTT